ncbi:sugar kinase [Bosea sp. 117]|uniref:sugar kinase n=1 Tax=Bosea sp. 117 TaxID=1125973 RepID=UPI000493D193|nr:sugar kinase [Bosea sp. 117]
MGEVAADKGATKVACIGECMIEVRQPAHGPASLGYGGDTLNTAVYLARLGIATSYVTALGDDSWSETMIAGWRAEGIDTSLVARLPGRLPGLYIIQTDARGERRFSYWRDTSAARHLFDLPETPHLAAALASFDLVYFSGITLSIYGAHGRQTLFAALDEVRSRGGRVAFDTNFRPRGWPDPAEAHDAFRRAIAAADIVFASSEDLELLWGASGPDDFMTGEGASERVLKLEVPACRVCAPFSADILVEAEPMPPGAIVDTTAAGDSFAAAFLASRLNGRTPAEAAAAGHHLARTVVQHSGAIIPRAAMPTIPA